MAIGYLSNISYSGQITDLLGGELVASLNHVCMWSEHGWVRVKAEEAARIHPGGTVSAHSGLFMCELCGQYVTLTDGLERIRYFRHSADEANKNCPERTFGSAYIPTYTAGEHELPIKLIVNRNDFKLELGLLYVPEKILNRQETQSVTIKTFEGGLFVFSFERLNPDSITYLPIGKVPSKNYEVIAPNGLSSYWPRKVRGIDESGSIFDYQTGKLLPFDADVQVKKKYYLLTAVSYGYSRRYSNININKVCEVRAGLSNWSVYEVEATVLDQEAAKFFLSLHCRLTDMPLKLNPIWPIHIETPYVIKHNQGYMIMHLSGGRRVTPQTFPRASVLSVYCPSEGQVIKIDYNGRQQLVSAGSASVLQYTYIWKEELSNTSSSVSIDVRDSKDSKVATGVQAELPDAGMIKITAPFGGTAIIRRKGTIIEKFKITSANPLTIDSIRYGMEIEVLQGLDIIWQATYVKACNLDASVDDSLYLKLCSLHGLKICVPHNIGSITNKLSGYPKTKGWIFSAIKSGLASEAAIKYLRNYVVELTNQ